MTVLVVVGLLYAAEIMACFVYSEAFDVVIDVAELDGDLE